MAGNVSAHCATDWIRLTFALVLVCAVLTATEALHRVDRAWFEFVSQSVRRGPVKPLAMIVVDERTTARLGNWPFSIETRERMMERLAGSGVAVVSIDLTGLRTPRARAPGAGQPARRQATALHAWRRGPATSAIPAKPARAMLHFAGMGLASATRTSMCWTARCRRAG